MAEKKENYYSISAPKEFFTGEGQEPGVAWAKGAHLTGEHVVNTVLLKSLAFAGVSLNDTNTTVAQSADFARVTNGSVFVRQEFEAHLFFESHWIFQFTAGSPAPTEDCSIEIQTWLNQYHILISPSGFANDWTVTCPPIDANQVFEFNQTFVGGIFNLELRKKSDVDTDRRPDFHLIEFLYRCQSLPSGWTVNIKPRMTMVFAAPTSQTQFVRV